MKLWARPLLMTGLGIVLFSAAAVAEKRPLAMLDQLAAEASGNCANMARVVSLESCVCVVGVI